jgi:hypothetical protein
MNFLSCDLRDPPPIYFFLELPWPNGYLGSAESRPDFSSIPRNVISQPPFGRARFITPTTRVVFFCLCARQTSSASGPAIDRRLLG